MHRMPAMNTWRMSAGLIAFWLSGGAANAGLVFLPHMGEYGKAVPGQYTGASLYYASYSDYYSRDEKVLHTIRGGAEINTVFLASAWVGNLFRDTDVPFLKDRPQICGMGIAFAKVQAYGSLREIAEFGGLAAGNNSYGDLLGLCTLQDITRTFGPVRGHIQLTGLVKFPIGDYDTGALFNLATNYWTYVPQLSLHADIGHLVVDATAAHQFNENNDHPQADGGVPTRLADWRNTAINVGWKFTHRWWVDAGFAYNRSVGSNTYDQFDSKPARQPVAGSGFCGGLGPPCLATGEFFLGPRPGSYQDRGTFSKVVSASIYYVYRSSMIVNIRGARAIAGRGSQFDVIYDVCTTGVDNCGPTVPHFEVPYVATGVGEAAAVVSEPFYELRFIFPMAAF